ncbi:ethylene-responsive transcription factor ABR1-like [Triticum urartu]|uniref:ethylene-responsive transcription factor ABR1-like n=1 Tax=Triticum urartu TaxID=4572 RepID=UPI0020431108|nr:ethylene-responsive transcription factor ABR1-like [Triticum urartu]
MRCVSTEGRRTVYGSEAGLGWSFIISGLNLEKAAGREVSLPCQDSELFSLFSNTERQLDNNNINNKEQGAAGLRAAAHALDLAHRFGRAYKLRRSPRGLHTATRALPAPSLCRLLVASSPRHHRATMPPRRRGSSGYRDIHERPSGTYYAEIRSSDVRLGLGTFETAHGATRAYDAAAWRLERPPSQINFRNVYTREQAQAVAPPPRLIMDQNRAEHRRHQRRLLIAEEDERAMAECRQGHPEDVANERAYWAERTARRRAEQADKRRRKAHAISQCDLVNVVGKSFFTSDYERWDDVWISTSDNTSEGDEDDSE